MGLFDKKYCDVCGEKIGLLGNRKLEDGNICSSCAKKLSPFFTERKKSTLNEIKHQLEYREQNKQNLNYFNPTRVLGNNTKVYIDDAQRKFVVSRKSDYRAENADMIDISQVTNVHYNVEEHRSELYTKDSQGRRVSYSPPRYECDYEITLYINVNSPYFSEIEFEVTDVRPDSRYTDQFRRYEQTANEIVMALSGNAVNMNGMGGYGQQNMGYNQQNNRGYNNQSNMGYPQQNMGAPQGFAAGAGFNNMQQEMPQATNGQQYQNAGYNNQQQFGQPPQQNFQQPQYQSQPQQQQFQQNGPWVCANCGATNDSKFCESCGSPKP